MQFRERVAVYCENTPKGILRVKSEYFLTENESQNYWAFGLCPWSGSPKTREDNVSEIGSVSVLT
jgi:hypothetical protein